MVREHPAASATTWKAIALGSAAVALSVVVLTYVRDSRKVDVTSGDVVMVSSGVVDASESDWAAPTEAELAAANAQGEGVLPIQLSAFGEPMPSLPWTALEADAGAGAGVFAVPGAAAAPGAPGGDDGSVASNDAGPKGAEELAAVNRDGNVDAGSISAGNTADEGVSPWAPPMSAGAGRFTTEAPYWGASAFMSNPDAGAGRFATDAPPWAASAFSSNPNAGAGPFTTERNLPAFGAVWPYMFLPIVPPPTSPP